MTAIISIGNEILLGKTLNTNLQYLASKLTDLGLELDYAITVKDIAEDIQAALKHCMENYDLVICTGGLGPTDDDITKKSIASYFSEELVFDEALWKHVSSLFTRRGMIVPEINRNQALVPKGFTTLMNELGTAPGLYYNHAGKHFFALPGVPMEMQHIFEKRILAILTKQFDLAPTHIRNIHTWRSSESALAEMLEDLAIPNDINMAWLPQTGRVDLRLYGKDLDIIEQVQMKILAKISKHIWGIDQASPAAYLGHLLRTLKLSISTAESCTGGLCGEMITSISGSSDYYKGGVISYSNEIKTSIMDVPESIIQKHGAVSQETAAAMLEGLLKKFETNLGVAITGIAGPTGGIPGKPVGTVFFAFELCGCRWYDKIVFNGNRTSIRFKAAEYAILSLIEKLREK